MLQEISVPYFGIAAIIFILQWLYIMFGTFRTRKSNIDYIKSLNVFIEEALYEDDASCLFLLILAGSMIWPITIIVTICGIVGSLILKLTRTVINNRMNKNKNK